MNRLLAGRTLACAAVDVANRYRAGADYPNYLLRTLADDHHLPRHDTTRFTRIHGGWNSAGTMAVVDAFLRFSGNSSGPRHVNRQAAPYAVLRSDGYLIADLSRVFGSVMMTWDATGPSRRVHHSD